MTYYGVCPECGTYWCSDDWHYCHPAADDIVPAERIAAFAVAGLIVAAIAICVIARFIGTIGQV